MNHVYSNPLIFHPLFTGQLAAVGPILDIALIALLIAAFWNVFQKAGRPGWEAIIPIYNVLILLKIINRPWWWIFLLIIPLVNLVTTFFIYRDLATSFGKGIGFTFGLFFLNIVFISILAFGDAQYTPIQRPDRTTPQPPQNPTVAS